MYSNDTFTVNLLTKFNLVFTYLETFNGFNGPTSNEPRNAKTGFLSMLKQRSRSAVQLHCTAD